MRRENQTLLQQNSVLRREHQQLQASYKMGMNENEQIRNECDLLEQRVQLEISMQEQLKSQL